MAPRDGDVLVLLGETRGHLGQSALLAEVFGREEGDAPPVDLAAERAAGEFVRAANAEGLVAAAHDLSDGGLAVAAAEMALAGGLGVDGRRPTTRWAPRPGSSARTRGATCVACAPAAVDRAAGARRSRPAVAAAGSSATAGGDCRPARERQRRFGPRCGAKAHGALPDAAASTDPCRRQGRL